MEELIKEKLKQLEIKNPTLSKAEVEKQRKELKAQLQPAKAISNNKDKSAAERISLLRDLMVQYVKYVLILG